MKKVFSLLLAVALVFSLALPAFAAEKDITYKAKNRIMITPATTVYTDTDLFGNMKGLMPGDVRYEEVKITNTAVDCDYVTVYFKAIPHGEKNNPSQKVIEAGETLEEMNKFLSQLHLEVKHGKKVIFSGPANEGSKSISLGKLNRFKTLKLDVTLTVPHEMGNEFAYREGEIDWQFLFEEGNNPVGTSPKTGDYIMMAVAIMALSGGALLLMFFLKKRKK